MGDSDDPIFIIKHFFTLTESYKFQNHIYLNRDVIDRRWTEGRLDSLVHSATFTAANARAGTKIPI